MTRSIIVRCREDRSKQMQILIGEELQIGVIHNNGLELLVIEGVVLDDTVQSSLESKISKITSAMGGDGK